MKKIVIVITALFACIGSLSAQKIGYINTEDILGGIPAYESAQTQLNTLSDKYRASIETELGKIESLYQEYQASRNSMSASQRQNAENEIIQKERVVQEKQKIYFGEDGIMAKRAEELIGPIRKAVDKAIEEVARKEGYDLIIDLASMPGVVYKNSALDLSARVLARYQENQ